MKVTRRTLFQMLVAAPLAALGVAVKFAPCLDEINRVTLKYISKDHRLTDYIFQARPHYVHLTGPPSCVTVKKANVYRRYEYKPTLPDDDDWEDEL